METQNTLITYILEAILVGEEAVMVATRVAGPCQQDINGDGALFCYTCASLIVAIGQKIHHSIYYPLSRRCQSVSQNLPRSLYLKIHHKKEYRQPPDY